MVEMLVHLQKTRPIPSRRAAESGAVRSHELADLMAVEDRLWHEEAKAWSLELRKSRL